MVYCRVLFEHTGVRFANTFRRRVMDGQTSERALSLEPVWDAGMTFARDERERSILRDDLLAIAGRSAEFDALNQLSKQGSKLKDIILNPTFLPWPEDGPDCCD